MEEEISLVELFTILKQKRNTILLLSIFGLLLSGVYTFFLVTPTYESSSRIVVNQTQNTSQSITNTDIQTNLNLINTYQSIIKEPIILENVLATTANNITIGELRNKISVQTEANSLVFGISVKDENPYVAADLANAVANSFEEKIGDILDVQSVTILSEAVPNLTSVSPNTIMNLVIGLVIGLFSGVGIAFLLEFMDKRVKDAKIIEELGWTNLGAVLEMSVSEVNETRMTNFIKTASINERKTRRRV